MEHFVFFCITYERDLGRFSQMVESFKKHNCDNIKMFVAVQNSNLGDSRESLESLESPQDSPKFLESQNSLESRKSKDSQDSLESPQDSQDSRDSRKSRESQKSTLAPFQKFSDENICIFLDSSFCKNYLLTAQRPKLRDFSRGYINQMIAKLAFWEANLCEHYFCVDSDTIFIRDFRREDFFYDEQTPYIVLNSDKNLHTKPYYSDFAKFRKEYIKRIFEVLDLCDSRFRSCHNSQIFSRVILSHFKTHFMCQKSLAYADLLEIAPLEFSWYNAYFQKCKLIKEVAIEDFCKIYHTKIEYIFDRIAGQSEENLAREYIAVILNSNWAIGGGRFRMRNMFEKTLYRAISRLL